MCTAVSFRKGKHYFGRNLDLHCSYGEEVCVMPRKYPLHFRQMGERREHYAMVGMATLVENIPLFYDGVNEFGLAMAGLNFPNNAYFAPVQRGKDNVSPFELIPWILCQCKSVAEAMPLLERLNLADIPFSENLPLSPLHWMISDCEQSVVVEQMKDGLHLYDNPVGVLANNPPFPFHLYNLNNYRNLRVDNGENTFAQNVSLENYCQGLGAVGLPGDVSSPSRFVRMAFAKENAVCKESELSCVGQFFHLLSFVEMPMGICKLPSGEYDITVYSSCIDCDEGIYYYTTYENRRITAVDMRKCDLNADTVCRFPLITEQRIYMQN